MKRKFQYTAELWKEAKDAQSVGETKHFYFALDTDDPGHALMAIMSSRPEGFTGPVKNFSGPLGVIFTD